MEIINTALLEKLLLENKRLFGGLLPELVKRLILSDKDNLRNLRIPGKDDVWAPGFDGIVENDKANLYLADGISVFEFGTSEDSLKKLNEDYKVRTRNSLGIDKSTTTFYLVLPKIWANKNGDSFTEWENSKKDWKKVIVIDAIKLCDWLKNSLEVAIWLLESCGETINLEVASVSSYWKEFSSRTKPVLNDTLFLINRTEEEKKFTDLINDKKVVKVRGDSIIDAIGFTLTAIMKIPFLRESVIVVKNIDSYKALSRIVENKLLLLLCVYEGDIDKNNNTILLYNKEYKSNKIDLEIYPINKYDFITALKSMDVSDSEVYKIVDDTHRNLPAVIRHLASETYSCGLPAWAKIEDKHLLVPLVFMKKINTDFEVHKQLVELFSGAKYSTFESKMKTFLALEDTPIKQCDSIYYLVSFEEAWRILELQTNETYFGNLTLIIKSIILHYADKDSEISPKVSELINDKNISHIPLNCFLEMLIYYSYIDNYARIKVSAFVKELFDECSISNVFSMLSSFFSLLAEAAPTVVSNYLFAQINIESSFTNKMMESNNYNSSYCRILEALEKLTLIEETKLQACDTLAILAQRDIKYKISNSPEKSLSGALCLWYTDGVLSIDEKKRLLFKYLKSNPQYFSYFAVKLIGTKCISHCGELRYGKAKDNPITIKEYFDTIDLIIEEIIDIAIKTKDIKLIQQIVMEYVHIYVERLESIADKLIYAEFDENELNMFNIYLLNLISNIKKYGKCKAWKESKAYLPALYKLYENSKSSDIFMQNECFFKKYYSCPIIDETFEENSDENTQHDWKEEERKRFEFRKEKYIYLKSQYGKDLNNKIIKILPNDEYNWGNFLAKVSEKSEFNEIFDELFALKKFNILTGFINNVDSEQIITKLNTMRGDSLLKILSIIERKDIYEILDDEEKKNAYWKFKEMWEYDNNTFNSLLKFNPQGLLRYYHNEKVNLNNYDNVVNLLDIIADDDINQINIYFIQELLEQCESIFYSDKLAMISLKLYQKNILEVFNSSICLYWFYNPAELLEIVINEEQEFSHLNIDVKYNYELPKQAYEDEVKFEFFMNYFIEAAVQTKNDFIFGFVGQLLGRSIIGKDGIFPHETIRKFIEKNDSPILRNGFLVAKFNTRGMRTILDGSPEKEIAQNYRNDAKKIQIDYPITAELLNNIAESYDKEARADYIRSELGFDY